MKSDEELADDLLDLIGGRVGQGLEGRCSVVIDAELNARLDELGDDVATALANRELVPKFVVGLSWFIFTELLCQAPFAADPEQLTATAWRWQARLQQIFGPQIAG